jgi:hypothetical protein
VKAFIDSFSGSAADIPKSKLTEGSVLSALLRDPKLSTWAMAESPKLRAIISKLELSGKIKTVASGYPWHRWEIINTINERLNHG